MTSAPARHTGRLLAVLLARPFMAQADATIANVATPSIHADLGASGAALELVIGGYLIAFAVLLITGARLGQTHGHRRVFLLGVGTFSLASQPPSAPESPCSPLSAAASRRTDARTTGGERHVNRTASESQPEGPPGQMSTSTGR